MAPRAKVREIIVERLGEELLVYEGSRHRADCLSPLEATVWSHCDGERDVPELTRVASEALGEEIPQGLVVLVLERLDRARLLEWNPPLRPPGTPGRQPCFRRPDLGPSGQALSPPT